MTKVLLKRNCSVGRKGDTVTVSEAYAQRLNESGAGQIIREHKAQPVSEQPATEQPAKPSGKKVASNK